MLVQVEQGHARQTSLAAPGTLAIFPPGIKVRIVGPPARLVRVLWDTELYSALLPELGVCAPQFEFLIGLQDPLRAEIVVSLAQKSDAGLADAILIESLGTALCIGIARHFVGHLPLPANKGLSLQRLQRVRDYVEAHLDDDLSLTVLADIACLSPYHFSRAFKQAVGVGPQRYVIQRRLERAKTLLRRTRQSFALIAVEAGFGDQSRFTTIFHREVGVTPRRFRAALA
jgi:AraC family transcriptional regulator